MSRGLGVKEGWLICTLIQGWYFPPDVGLLSPDTSRKSGGKSVELSIHAELTHAMWEILQLAISQVEAVVRPLFALPLHSLAKDGLKHPTL